MVPKGWELTTVGSACNIKNNLRLPISSEEREKVVGDYPYFGPTGILGYINEYKIDEEFALIGEDGDHFLKHKEKEMTLMFTGKANVNNHAHIITNSDKCLVSWFHAYFVHRDISSHLTRQGAKRYKLTKAALEKLEILLPPYAEQQKIAKILSVWDKAITTTKQLLANSQQQKKSLMQKLLTGKMRFSIFSEKWNPGHLCDIAKISKGKALSSKDLKAGNFPVVAGGKSSPYSHAEYTHENVITVSASGAYAGYVAYYGYKIWASDCSVVEADKNSDIKFIYQLMMLNQQKIYSLQSGGAQPHIYPKDLNSLKIEFPTKEEQKKISSVLSILDDDVETLQRKLSCLQQEKVALMQQLLTGKRRVIIN